MISFKPLTLEDIKYVKPFLNAFDSRTCDYTVGGMFMWRNFYKMECCFTENAFFTRLFDENGNIYYSLPFSNDIESAINFLIGEIVKDEDCVRFCTVPESYTDIFYSFGKTVKITENRDFFDYIYNAEDLLTLKGKKHAKQRNLIHQFIRDYPDWSFSPLNEENIGDVSDFFKDMFLSDISQDENPARREENMMTLEVLENNLKYGMSGGVLKVDGKIIGFSLGEAVKDTLFIHIEKADRKYKGAYQMLTNRFLKMYVNKNISYINREEDMGDEGLRKAKSAYSPYGLLKKYTVELKKDRH